MATGKEQALAMYQGKALRRQRAETQETGIRRAVANVLDGSCESIADAAKGQGVPEEPVRLRVRAAREAMKGGKT